MAGGDQEMARKKLGTTVEELKMCAGTDAKAGSHGVQGLSKAGRYPVVLAGVAVVTGIGAAMYYKSLNHEPESDAKGEVEAVLDSVPIPDAPADAAAA